MKRREKKKHADQRRLEQGRFQTKGRLETVLSALGLRHDFAKLPSDIRTQVFRSLPAKPRVCVESAARDVPELAVIKGEIEQGLDEEELPANGSHLVPLSEFLSTCVGILGELDALRSAPLPQKYRPIVMGMAETVEAFYAGNEQRASHLLMAHVHVNLALRSRPDTRIFGCRLEKEQYRRGGPIMSLVLFYSEPRQAHVELDGITRRVFQCGAPSDVVGILWPDADCTDFGVPNGRRYPFFVQSHALRRLRERLPLGVLAETWIQLGLSDSLANPKVIRHDEAYLVEYRLGRLRAGYLVARVVAEKIVLTTFLLLTMKGTPEFRLLEERLRLTRRDTEFVGLDRIETFLRQDVWADSHLVEVLEQCGCGSLLKLGREVFPRQAAGNCAAELRRFLGLCAPGSQELFKKSTPAERLIQQLGDGQTDQTVQASD